jgi:hypothetical protein
MAGIEVSDASTYMLCTRFLINSVTWLVFSGWLMSDDSNGWLVGRWPTRDWSQVISISINRRL